MERRILMRSRRYQQMVIVVGMFFCTFLMGFKAHAKEVTTNITINEDIFSWSDTQKIEVSQQTPKSFSIVIDNSEEGYTFGTIGAMLEGAYRGVPILKEEYGAIACQIQNTGESSIYLAITLKDQNQNILEPKSNASVIVEVDGVRQVYVAENGQIELEPGFKGKIIFPLGEYVKVQEEFSEKEIAFWGMSFVVEGATKAALEVEELYWENQSAIKPYAEAFDYKINGNSTIVLSEIGQVIDFYQLEPKESTTLTSTPFQLEVKQLTEGVSLEDSGKLVITPEADSQVITLKATNEEGLVLVKKVKLLEAIPNLEREFLQPEDFEDISYPFAFITSKTINLIRVGLVVSLIFILGAYWWGMRRVKKQDDEKEGM